MILVSAFALIITACLLALWTLRPPSFLPADLPGSKAHKGHPSITLVGGGPAILLTLLATGLLLGGLERPRTWVLLGAIGLGLVDDYRDLPWIPKLGGQCLLAFLAAQTLPTVPLIQSLPLLVLLMNAWNYLDNSDGCLAFVAISGLLGLALAGAPIPFFLLGCLFGFLPFNWPKARFFLGDSGSQFVGLSMGLLVFDLGGLSLAHLGIQLLPLVDLLQVSIVRILERRPPWIGDRRHLAHLLEGRLPKPLPAPLLGILSFGFSFALYRLHGIG
jgi:UDP-GlcNAc:undecaprenyl-phosphate GlcNAc-1-phosphate transferase